MSCADSHSGWSCGASLTLSIFLLTLLFPAANASADWMFGGYMGVSSTASNTLTVTPTAGSPFTVNDVSYKGQPFLSPIYYGVRAGWIPSGRGPGVEVEWTHAKAIAQLNSAAHDLNAFQQSHGLNFLLANAVFRLSPSACNTRCTVALRGGAGISTPHVESTFRNVHQEQYQYGGVAWQVGAGLEYRVWQFAWAVADAKLTRVNETHLRGADVEIAGPFFVRHVDFGVAFRFPPH